MEREKGKADDETDISRELLRMLDPLIMQPAQRWQPEDLDSYS
jgi:hypothetical protein